MSASTLFETENIFGKKDYGTLESDTTFFRKLEQPEAKVTAKKAAWIKETVTAERRSRLRSKAAFEVKMQSLNDQLKPVGEPQPATILNFSEEGVCLEHVALVAEQYVSISWNDSHQHSHVAVIHLKWCRSTHERRILCGGRVCSMETAG